MLESIWSFLLDFVSKPDQVLLAIIEKYHNWVYVFLFLIIFAETGLIIASFLMPFLPGDALIFTIGLLAQEGSLNIYLVIPLLIFAAILGDNLNYFVGRKFGGLIKEKKKILFLKKEYITQTETFFEKNGGKAVIMARFVPIVRTIAPFVAGAGSMQYYKYIFYCITGAIIWVTSITFLGYFLGQVPWVKANFEKVVLLIVILSVLPIILKLFKKKKGTEIQS